MVETLYICTKVVEAAWSSIDNVAQLELYMNQAYTYLDI